MNSAVMMLGRAYSIQLCCLRTVTGSVVCGPPSKAPTIQPASVGVPFLARFACDDAMTEADPIEPLSDEDIAEPSAVALARIRTEVWQIARQVQALATEVDHIRRLHCTGSARDGTRELDRWAIYAIREQQMTQMLSNMVHVLQTFLQERAATPLP